MDDDDEYQALSNGLIDPAEVEERLECLHAALGLLVFEDLGDQFFVFPDEVRMVFGDATELQKHPLHVF